MPSFWLVQLLIRQLPQNLAESVAWRNMEKRNEDEFIRNSGAPLRRFTYAAPGSISTCEAFLKEDSSINILELLGDVPDDSDKMDSDKYLQERMRLYGQERLNTMSPDTLASAQA
jgi:hypothetical protein